jgi:hypothetical protein
MVISTETSVQHETIIVAFLGSLRHVQKGLKVTNTGLNENDKGLVDMTYKGNQLKTMRRKRGPGFVCPPPERQAGGRSHRYANAQLKIDLTARNVKMIYRKVARVLAAKVDPDGTQQDFVSDIFIMVYRSNHDQAEHTDMPGQGTNYWTVSLGPRRTTMLPFGSEMRIPPRKRHTLVAWHGDVPHAGSGANKDTHVRMFMTFWGRGHGADKMTEDPNVTRGSFVPFLRIVWQRGSGPGDMEISQFI